jgi:hypothetical protein
VGTEFVIEGDMDSIFETDDGIDSVMDQVGGWAYLMNESNAHFDDGGYFVPGYIVSAGHLRQMVDAREVLAKQHGDEARTFSYDRPQHSVRNRSHTRPLNRK